MTTTNDITGDSIQSRTNTKKFRDGWDNIFNKDKAELTSRAESSDPAATFTAGDFEGMTREEAKEEMRNVLRKAVDSNEDCATMNEIKPSV